MKTNELRKGNKIKYHDKIITVAGIVRNTIYYESKELCFDSNVGEYKPFQPIQLTEEWLLKFGFKKIKDTWITNKSFHYENGKCWIYLIENGFEFELITLSERHNLCNTYKFVHQLQNLYFAITGEELAIA